MRPVSGGRTGPPLHGVNGTVLFARAYFVIGADIMRPPFTPRRNGIVPNAVVVPRLSIVNYQLSITDHSAISKASSIMAVNVFCLSSLVHSSPVTRLSEMVHTQSACLPARAALK
ncbi:MAG: hypothetical protein BWY35_00096 [Firmicutes bacterium ADurb.Bin248]|nr:MAG: hypothetical protein BWY35_00096 [Firmicutes bacterium ADurb.Bin248]